MVELSVNNEILDMDIDTEFSMSFQVNDFLNIGERQGDFSYEFELPNTSKNNRLLGRPSGINAIPYQKIQCSLSARTILINGFVQVVGFDEKIKVNFFSGNSNWFNSLGEKKLMDLYLTDLDHEYTGPNARASFTATDGYVYMLCDYDGISDIVTVMDTISHTDLFPGIYVSTLIKRIFNEIGIKVSGSLIDSPDYQRLCLPYIKSAFSNNSQYYKDRSLKIGLLADWTSPSQSIQWDDLTDPYYQGEFYQTPAYKPTDIHTVTASAHLHVSAIVGAGAHSIDLMQNAVSLQNIGVVATIDYDLSVSGIQVAPGDQIYIRINTVGAETLTVDTTSYFQIVPDQSINSGDHIIMADMVCDLTQAELIKYVLVSFGTIPIYDDLTKTIYLERFSTIKTNAADDWSAKYVNRDELNFSEYVSGYSKLNKIVYDELDDSDTNNFLSNYLSMTAKNFGDGQFSITNDFIQGENEIYKAPFVPVWWEKVTIAGPKSEWLMRFIRDDKPRICLCLANTGHALFNDFGSITVSGTVCTNLAYGYFTKFSIGTNLDKLKLNLSYGPVVWAGESGTYMLERYWTDFILILQDPKIVRAYMKLTDSDILNLNFLKAKYIKGKDITGLYFLNKILDYDFTNNPALCELIKL